jgi:hypothetical protein
MTIKVGGHAPHPQNGTISRKGAKKPEATTSGFHGGSGRPKGVVHDAPTLPQINSANYGAQKVKRK